MRVSGVDHGSMPTFSETVYVIIYTDLCKIGYIVNSHN